MSKTPFSVRLESWALSTLFDQPLGIPEYQRSYSWRSSHVHDLLKDIFERATPYLMGTVILHDTVDPDGCRTLDIVDGQQRLVTLTVLLHVLCERPKVDPGRLPLLAGKFNEGSAGVIRKNRQVILEFLAGKSDDDRESFRKRLLASHDAKSCLLFTVLVLSGENAMDRAYSFFDSVNSKGKALSDFDLLKAHHLMYIPPKQEALASSHNDEWLRRDEFHAHLFSTTLRRIRMWGRNENRDTKRERPDYNEFCSVVEPEHETNSEHVFNRYMQPVAFRSWRRVGEKIVLSMDYPVLDGEVLIPTQVTQTIEGGDAFFLYAKRYHDLDATLFEKDAGRPSTGISFVRGLADHMDNPHLQNAFRAVMLLYFDKFGEDRIIDVGVCTERIISAWRWHGNVRIEGTLNHVRGKRLVPILLESVTSLHAHSQLLGVAQSLEPVPQENMPLRGVKLRYHESMTRFYTQERFRILDIRTHSLARFYVVDGT